ncbi:MAG TPA: hypothetical protein VKP30_09785, partial [Polyangiaceae bacterium]|nr:hypothetical protein [Polyangiaceae bacterium]
RLFTHVGRRKLLCGEYQKAASESSRYRYQYSQFSELYSTWRGTRRLSIRQTHRRTTTDRNVSRRE